VKLRVAITRSMQVPAYPAYDRAFSSELPLVALRYSNTAVLPVCGLAWGRNEAFLRFRLDRRQATAHERRVLGSGELLLAGRVRASAEHVRSCGFRLRGLRTRISRQANQEEERG
jgi:hypothetical protein